MKKFAIKNAILAAALSCSSVQALEVGRINVLSGFNQPMKATVELRDVPISEVDSVVGKTAENFGIKNQLPKLMIKPIVVGGQTYLSITSIKPVITRTVDLMIEVSSPSGHVMRGYSFVLNDIEVTEQTTQMKIATPVYHSRNDSGYISAPSAARIVQAEIDGDSTSSITVGKGDTLGKIAESLVMRGGKVSRAQMMVAVFKANPDDFIGSMNNLKSGVILRIPALEEVARIDNAYAIREIRGQLQQWGDKQASIGQNSQTKPLLSITVDASGVSAADVLANSKELEESKKRIAALEKSLTDVSRLVVMREEAKKTDPLLYITVAVSAAFLLLIGFVIGMRRTKQTQSNEG